MVDAGVGRCLGAIIYDVSSTGTLVSGTVRGPGKSDLDSTVCCGFSVSGLIADSVGEGKLEQNVGLI